MVSQATAAEELALRQLKQWQTIDDRGCPEIR
jgi:hypothetical protein